jgi:hypothetical protein
MKMITRYNAGTVRRRGSQCWRWGLWRSSTSIRGHYYWSLNWSTQYTFSISPPGTILYLSQL